MADHVHDASTWSTCDKAVESRPGRDTKNSANKSSQSVDSSFPISEIRNAGIGGDVDCRWDDEHREDAIAKRDENHRRGQHSSVEFHTTGKGNPYSNGNLPPGSLYLQQAQIRRVSCGHLLPAGENSPPVTKNQIGSAPTQGSCETGTTWL